MRRYASALDLPVSWSPTISVHAVVRTPVNRPAHAKDRGSSPCEDTGIQDRHGVEGAAIVMELALVSDGDLAVNHVIPIAPRRARVRPVRHQRH
eukprot:5706921-Prymnesium_polylepis.1